MKRLFLLCIMVMLSLSACKGSVSYQPPLIPITITIDTDGQVTLSVGGSVQTSLGTFSADLSTKIADLTPDAEGTLTVQIDGKYIVYDLKENEDFEINLESGYYRQVGLQRQGKNWILTVERISSQGAEAGQMLPPCAQTGCPQREVYFPLNNCAGSRLQQGDAAIISPDGGRNAIRSSADTHPSSNIIGYAEPGDQIEITAGPVCNYGWILWKVRVVNSGLQGWTPETDGKKFWIERVD